MATSPNSPISATSRSPEVGHKAPMAIFLAAPRGFCAGVDRAIKIVELALQKYGAPVYVRHEIVHNRFVVDSLKAKGAIFVEELDDIPDTDQPVIFSAHGVAKSIPEAAKSRNMFVLDATCPLVFKVHMEAARHYANDCHIVMVGHKGHPEVIGTMGQLPGGAVTLIETVEEAEALAPANPAKLAFVTQTTLSVDDTAEMVAVLKRRFPNIIGPAKEDICYATTNRQAAVKTIAGKIGHLLVVGAPNSSNSLRLVEVAQRGGCANATLVQRASDIPWMDLAKDANLNAIGVTAGASAPEVLVEEVVDALKDRYDVTVEVVSTAEENVAFNIPKALRNIAS